MTVTLPPELESYVTKEVNSGKYSSPEECVAAGLLTLLNLEERYAWLKLEIQKGLDSPIIDKEFSMDELLEEIAREEAEGRAA